ncbi:translation initiation factor eIF4e [Lentinula aciculospora]|uniref:Translation initiation factor eIF4e n=1 Tax=Lentinula aciculospora TaxID=153920 RepID=A0A9W8ZUZ9_9AGAR|nr:translation initiation factor eIF4e [Lentinula aciculospora]
MTVKDKDGANTNGASVPNNNLNVAPTMNSTAAPRPRLAASILRTTSNASINSAASSADSMAVNVANSTRAGSPSLSLSTVSTPRSNSPSTILGPEGGESLTVDKLDKLNEMTGLGSGPPSTLTSKPAVKGYKNIPSLDAITARLAKTRALSIDGTPKPPEPEMFEDPKTPGVQVMKEELPLQYSWTIYHDSKAKFPYTPAPNSANPTGVAPALVPRDRDYEANLTVIGTFTTVEQFCRYFNWLKPPSLLERNSNYHLFKSPIKPMWEDPANASGGKWVLTMRNNPELLDRCWSWLCMALVGEELEEGGDEICGAVVSLRAKVDRIQVWTRRKDDVEKLNAIGKKLVKLLDIGGQDGIGLEFQYNTEDRGDRERGVPSKFLSIQAAPTSSYRSTFQGAPGSAVGNGAGAFGSFGVPLGSAGWRRRG